MSLKPFFWLLAGMFLVSSCSKTDTRQAETGSPEGEEVVLELSADPLGVFVLDGSLNEIREDGKVYWKSAVNAGDTVNWTDEKQELQYSNGNKRIFYRVLSDGTEYWVQEYFIAGPAVPAVIANNDAVLYTKPEPSSVARTGTVTLPKFTLVAMLDDDNLTDDFIRIAAFLGEARPAERYVKIKDISWDQNDVGGVKLTRIAAVTKNPAAHKELLKNAMEILEKGKSFFGVSENLSFEPALFELEVTNNLEILSAGEPYYTVQNSVNARDLPTINGNIVEKLPQFKPVFIVAKSKKEEKLKINDEEISGVWLRTDGGNWIFSHYLSNQGAPGEAAN